MAIDAELFRNVIASLAGLSFGAAAYALVVHASKLRTDWRTHVGYLLVKLAWFLVVGPVFILIILPTASIPPTGAAWAFLVGLMFAAVGFVWVARIAGKDS